MSFPVSRTECPPVNPLSITPDETPLHSRVEYRHIAASATCSGEGIALSGAGIRFRGDGPFPVGEAAEVRIDAVKGLAPPLLAYIEVSHCEREASGAWRIAGVIKGIRSE